MICASIQNKSAESIRTILDKVEMAELRMDLCDLTDEQLEEIFTSDTPVIATCRAKDGDFRETERKLTLAVQYGARYADLEIEAPGSVGRRVEKACEQWGTVLIRSYHDFTGTPSIDQLKEITDRCRHSGAAVVKIVTTANSPEDVQTIESLYNYYTAESLVAFAMGKEGQESRLNCLRKGAPFSYAAVSEDDVTAPGQIAYERMYAEVYGDRKAVKAELRVPSSKSYAQRAIIAAALCNGTSTLTGYTPCGDSDAALRVALQLGANIESQEQSDGTRTLTITGMDASESCLTKGTLLVGESGLLTRLMAPLGCELFRDGVKIEGEGCLATRPLPGLDDTVRAMGAQLSCKEDMTVPLSLVGPLKPGRIVIDGSKSSQLVSGALMALPFCGKNSTLCVESPASIPYIFMTLDMLHKFGIKSRSEMYGGRRLLENDFDKCTEIVLKIKENQRYTATNLAIEGDWSAATVFLAAGAIFGQISLEGLDTSSLQPDLCMLDILMDAGASVSQLDEPKGLIMVKKAPLAAIQEDLTNSPDLFPVVAVFCAFCQGRSLLRGVGRLKHKESDRAGGILEMLTKMGVQAQIKSDDLIINGESLDSRIMNKRLLKGGKYSSNHDHRMVMALKLASLGADSEIIVDDLECVAKSFPQFNGIWNEYVRK